MNGLIGADQFMRYTDKNGTSWVQQHRVIAGGRFVEAMAEQYAKEGGKAEAITKAAFDAARKGQA